jgi:hypothetical protein
MFMCVSLPRGSPTASRAILSGPRCATSDRSLLGDCVWPEGVALRHGGTFHNLYPQASVRWTIPFSICMIYKRGWREICRSAWKIGPNLAASTVRYAAVSRAGRSSGIWCEPIGGGDEVGVGRLDLSGVRAILTPRAPRRAGVGPRVSPNLQDDRVDAMQGPGRRLAYLLGHVPEGMSQR